MMLSRINYIQLTRPSNSIRDENPASVKFNPANGDNFTIEVSGAGSITVDRKEMMEVVKFLFPDLTIPESR